jgi:hypothetical protein
MPSRRNAETAVTLRPKPNVWTLDDVSFDPETHTSRLPDGTDVPHVTAILRAVGLSADYQEMAEDRPRLAAAIEHARDRGTAVHADCHSYDDDDLDLDDVDDRVRPYVEAWARYRTDTGFRPVLRERRIFSARYCYTGTLDGVFAGPDGLRTLVDIKTGDPSSAAANVQTAAYRFALEETDPLARSYSRIAVWLRPGRRVPYEIFPYYQNAADATTWLAALTIYRAQYARRKQA